MAVQVLMVDDEAELARATTDYLSLCGVSAAFETDPAAAVARWAEHSPSVLLLDINMPGKSGFELCRWVRDRSQAPIIFLSARETESDEILALSIGGDDYVRKPFSMAVLLAKVRRCLERGQASAPAGEGFRDDRLVIDLATDRVWLEGRELAVPATEFRLLRHLVEHRGRVVPKEELLDEVWQGFVSEGTLSVHVRRLRTRIEPDPDNPVYVRTVWGRGYLFEAPKDR